MDLSTKPTGYKKVYATRRYARIFFADGRRIPVVSRRK